jgi:hypothetical protein
MSFAIRIGIPEMLDLWTDLSKKKTAGTISKKELALYNKWGKAMRLLSQDPSYPSLHTHDIEPLTKRYGVKVWQSYLENNTSRAMRMYWVYGPDRQDITIIGLEPHPEDKKNGAYDKISLSDMPNIDE